MGRPYEYCETTRLKMTNRALDLDVPTSTTSQRPSTPVAILADSTSTDDGSGRAWVLCTGCILWMVSPLAKPHGDHI